MLRHDKCTPLNGFLSKLESFAKTGKYRKMLADF